MPGDTMPEKIFLGLASIDKVGHTMLFAILVLILLTNLVKQFRMYHYLNAFRLLSLTVGILYGGLIEIIQFYYYPGRMGDIRDFVADIIGCFLGLLVFRLIYGNIKSLKSR